MSCCGKSKQYGHITKGQKVGRIVKGTVRAMLGRKSRFAAERIRTCRTCNENTWLKISEYSQFLLKHGIDVIKNLDQLEKLPPLPKSDKGRNLYCRICKCFIPGKARVDDEQCPLGRWEK